MPTLLEKNTLIPDASITKDVAADTRAIDYIIRFIEKRLPLRNVVPINPQGIGDKVLVLQASTGSGKSVTVAPEIYKNFHERIGRNIAVTQPRVISATSTPLEIIKYYNMTLGKDIGFVTGAFSQNATRGVIYMTIGVLTQHFKMLDDEQLIRRYSVIIIDEVHERSINADLTLYMIKRFLQRNYSNPRCPFVILMSATIDTGKISRYFDKAPVIKVRGESYPIQDNYVSTPVSNFAMSAAFKAIELHNQNTDDYDTDKRDILIFAHSVAAIDSIVRVLEKHSDTKNPIIPISLTSAEYRTVGPSIQKLYGKIPSNARRVIVATNVAETSVTIDTLKYCIDTGMYNAVEYNPVGDMTTIIVKPVAQSMATQRRGRVGRKTSGQFYALYTAGDFKKLVPDQYPGIIVEESTANILAQIVVESKVQKIKDFNASEHDAVTYRFDLLDPIPAASLHNTYSKLYHLNLIHNSGPTLHGVIASKFVRFSVESIRMVLAGYYHKANVNTLITIAAGLSAGSFQMAGYIPYDIFQGRADGWLNKVAIADEFIEFALVFDRFKRELIKNNALKWCTDNKINYNTLLAMSALRDEFLETMRYVVGLNPFENHFEHLEDTFAHNFKSGMDEVLRLKKCIYAGFHMNLLRWSSKHDSYITRRSQQVRITSSKVEKLQAKKVFDGDCQNFPQLLLYDHLVYRMNFKGAMQYKIKNAISVIDGFYSIV